MSLKRNCDGCGAIIDSDAEHDYPDLAIYIGESESPAYEYEDLCDDCKSIMLRRLKTIFDRPVEMDDAAKHAEHQKPEIPEHIETVQPPHIDTEPMHDAEPELANQPEPIHDADDDGERIYANGVIRQFPVISHRPNR